MEIDICNFYYKPENQNLEFKESFEKDTIAESMAAFATSTGGYILIGVKNDGSPKGVNVDSIDSIRNKIYDISKNLTGGRVFVEVDFKDYSEFEKIIVLRVHEGDHKPYGWKGAFYKRVDASDEKLDPDEITKLRLSARQLTLDSLSGRIFDRVANISDIDGNKLEDYRIRMTSGKRNKIINNDSIQNILQNLDLINKSREIKNAGLLFFGKDPQKAFPQSRINFLIYSGEDIDSSELKSRKVIEGSALSQIEEAIDLIRANTENRIIMEGLSRIEINQYPLPAIREAIINAIAHRNYAVVESDITIKLFLNRLEIYNPGGLMEGVKLDELKKGGHPSVRRNPIICKLLDNIGLMEQSGQGIKNMIVSMKKFGLNEPLISADKDFFRIEFGGQKVRSSSEGVSIFGRSTNLKLFLNENEQKGLKYIKEFSLRGITISQYMKATGIKSRITAKKHLDKFEYQGLLRSKIIGKERIYNKQYESSI